MRGEAFSVGGSHRRGPEIGASGAGRSAVYEVIQVGSVAGGGWVASLHEAFSSATEVGIRSRYSDDSQSRAVKSDNSLTIPSRPFVAAYNRNV